MNGNVHITPIIIERYCLGLLSAAEASEVARQAALQPALKQEIDRFMNTLEQRLMSQPVAPPKALRTQTLALLHNLKVEEAGHLNGQPVLNKYSDYKNWLRLVTPLLPEKLDQEMFVREIRNDDRCSQILIWTAVDYPDEVHDDVHESFIILQGRCRCLIEGDEVELGPGGFLEIPLHKHHDVQVLESPVLAVVQRLKAA